MSRTLSTKAGSVESLKVFERCGCTPKSGSVRSDRALGETGLSSGRANGPVCAFGRLLVQNGAQQTGNSLFVVGSRPTRTASP